ncbi:MerR family transcriptional regulator [Arcanobacterium hippocoleae]|uniref:MerR family transcriptional regulator n=1 Tax=Arcanobacterium hippocoleae TaxID=149017 RepID=UPI0033401D5C
MERLRFILIEQRDRYVSLPQIKEQLRQLDSGQANAEHPGKMRVLKDAERFTVQAGTRLHKAELAALTGASIQDLEELAKHGILQADARGRLTAQAVDIVRYVMLLSEQGFDLRQLRAVRNSAHAHAVNTINQLSTDGPRGTSRGKERMIAQAAQISSLLTNLYRALLVDNIEIELR